MRTLSRRVLVRDLVLPADIGVYAHERGRLQRLCINLNLGVDEPASSTDQLDEVVCYRTLIDQIRSMLAAERFNLVETVAERIVALCLAEPRVAEAGVRVEKLDAVPEAVGVGIELVRARG
jgi:dihydroneopterin aldolase